MTIPLLKVLDMRWIDSSQTVIENVLPPEELATIKRQCRISPPAYLPTPDQIRAACRRIRSGWSAAEERTRRAAGRRVAWALPQLRSHCHD